MAVGRRVMMWLWVGVRRHKGVYLSVSQVAGAQGKARPSIGIPERAYGAHCPWVSGYYPPRSVQSCPHTAHAGAVQRRSDSLPPRLVQSIQQK